MVIQVNEKNKNNHHDQADHVKDNNKKNSDEYAVSSDAIDWENDEYYIPNTEFEQTWQQIWNQKQQEKTSDFFNQDQGDELSSVAQKSPLPLKRKKHKWLKTFIACFLIFTTLYCIAVFSNFPFILKWRTLYIETAMGTLSHHWLATAFIPKSVIDEVMNGSANLDELQNGINSNWKITAYTQKELYQTWKKLEPKFLSIYSEIEKSSFQAYTNNKKNSVLDPNGFLVIDKSGLKDGGTSIKTNQGDDVLAIDTENGITIVKITGEGYVARLAIVKDPSRVGVGIPEDFGKNGSVLGELAQYNNAVLAINASGFDDPGGHGNGGKVYGLVISDGKLLNNPAGGTYKTIAFDQNHKLNIGQYKSSDHYRDGVEFKPALIINEKKLVSGSAGWGIQPRSAIGQTKKGEVLLLIVDGRAPGYSIGCTVGDLANIMERYGAVQACNLDGGSSSLLYYRGREISKPSAANKQIGRRLPNGFIVSARP